MSEIGYFVDHKSEDSDLYVCAKCVEDNGLSKHHPVDKESFAIIPIACGVCRYGADPKDYV